MSATTANPAEFQDGGKPVAQPVYQVDINGNPVSPAGSTTTNAIGTQANPLATNQVVGTPVYNSSTAVAAAQCVATLPAVAGKTTYINGFTVTTHSPTANVFGTVTVSLDGGTTTHLSYILCESSTVGGDLNIDFPDPIPATASNKTIVITLPAVTSGAVSAIATYGYQL
jgi:hypothetical protein